MHVEYQACVQTRDAVYRSRLARHGYALLSSNVSRVASCYLLLTGNLISDPSLAQMHVPPLYVLSLVGMELLKPTANSTRLTSMRW